MLRRRVRAQLDQQIADRGAGQARVEQGDQEGDGREAEEEERHALHHEKGVADEEGAHHQQRGAHRQGDDEGVHQQRRGAAQRRARLTPPVDEHHDAHEGEPGEGDELEVEQRHRQVRLLDEGQHVVRAEAAERQADQLQSHRDEVGGADDPSFRSPGSRPEGKDRYT